MKIVGDRLSSAGAVDLRSHFADDQSLRSTLLSRREEDCTNTSRKAWVRGRRASSRDAAALVAGMVAGSERLR